MKKRGYCYRNSKRSRSVGLVNKLSVIGVYVAEKGPKSGGDGSKISVFDPTS